MPAQPEQDIDMDHATDRPGAVRPASVPDLMSIVDADPDLAGSRPTLLPSRLPERRTLASC